MGFLSRVWQGIRGGAGTGASGLPDGMVVTDFSSQRGGFGFEVRGEASYQHALRRLSGGRAERGEEVRFRVVLRPEPTNRQDSNAVAVYAEGDGLIGYIARENAAEIQVPLLKLWTAHQVAGCPAKLIGGGPDKPTLGVVLGLDASGLVGHRFMQT